MRIGWRRLVAWLVDWACILVWVAVTAAVGIPLYRAGFTGSPGTGSLGTGAANLVAALVVVAPVVVAAAWCESRTLAATPGKRALGLTVRGASGPPSFAAAIVRNLMKIGVPWLIGHAAVYAIVATSGAVPLRVWILTGAAYACPLVWVGSLFVAGGRTPYDRLSRTRVTPATAIDPLGHSAPGRTPA